MSTKLLKWNKDLSHLCFWKQILQKFILHRTLFHKVVIFPRVTRLFSQNVLWIAPSAHQPSSQRSWSSLPYSFFRLSIFYSLMTVVCYTAPPWEGWRSRDCPWVASSRLKKSSRGASTCDSPDDLPSISHSLFISALFLSCIKVRLFVYRKHYVKGSRFTRE